MPDQKLTLSQIIAPLDTNDFLRNYWTRKLLHLAGPPNKFDHLFSWEALNRGLESKHFDSEQLRLAQGGKYLDEKRYLRDGRVHATKLIAELSNGATLIYNSCAGLFPHIRDFRDHLEQIFHVRPSVNLYAGWRSDNGFDVHWDDHETIILQVSGRKRWKVWNPTRLHPFRPDAVPAIALPTEAPIWDGILETGSLFAIPRGWWHVAYPMNEPTVHLTIGVPTLHGIGMLHWLAESMKTSEASRMAVPLFASAEERRQWLSQVFADLTAQWDEGMPDRYIEHVDSLRVSSPIDLAREPLLRGPRQLERSTLLQLASRHPLIFSGDGEMVSIIAGREGTRVSRAVAEKLKLFNDFRAHSLADLSREPDSQLNAAVGMLMMTGTLRFS